MKSVSAVVWLAPLLLALSACHALRAKSCHGRSRTWREERCAAEDSRRTRSPRDRQRAAHTRAQRAGAPGGARAREPCLDERPRSRSASPRLPRQA